MKWSYVKVKCLLALPNCVNVLPQMRHWPPPPTIRSKPENPAKIKPEDPTYTGTKAWGVNVMVTVFRRFSTVFGDF
jgi:hypothetical protein